MEIEDENNLIQTINISKEISLLNGKKVTIFFNKKYFFDPFFAKYFNLKKNNNNITDTNFVFDRNNIGFCIINSYFELKEGIIINEELFLINPKELLEFTKYLLKKFIWSKKIFINSKNEDNKNILFYFIEKSIVTFMENENYLYIEILDLINFFIDNLVNINEKCDCKIDNSNINHKFTVTNLICYLYRGIKEYININENIKNFNRDLYNHYLKFLEILIKLIKNKGGDFNTETTLDINGLIISSNTLLDSKLFPNKI
jgi:hypothetical protein